MRLLRTRLTPALAEWLRQARDPGQPELAVSQEGDDVLVMRASGAELSEDETIELHALAAAHAAEPLKHKKR